MGLGAGRAASYRAGLGLRLGRALLSACTALVILAAPAVPLVGLVTHEEAGPYCGRDGRCCCAAPAQSESDGPCLSSLCGCDSPEPSALPGPLSLCATLTDTVLLSSLSGSGERLAIRLAGPRSVRGAPPKPPPERPRSA